jgi:secondary thiamine-phosphate synthase enzyme
VASTGYQFHADVTDLVADALRERGAGTGLAGVFAAGSTVGLVIMRYEPGAVDDLFRALEEAAPVERTYRHGLTTGDPNGFSHVRSTLLGTSVLVPWRAGAFAMSSTHRVVLVDFDLKPATRTLLVDPPRADVPAPAPREAEVLV